VPLSRRQVTARIIVRPRCQEGTHIMDNISNGMKTVYTVVEGSKGKSFWVKVGVGFLNKDGSINLKLDAVPVNGTLQVRDYEPREEQASFRGGASAGALA
jgi:hypothetical protein